MQMHIQLNETKWRTYALVNKAIIGFQEVAILFQPCYKWELMISLCWQITTEHLSKLSRLNRLDKECFCFVKLYLSMVVARDRAYPWRSSEEYLKYGQERYWWFANYGQFLYPGAEWVSLQDLFLSWVTYKNLRSQVSHFINIILQVIL